MRFLKVEGNLPRELHGTLYRNGPNPQFDAPGAHWFVGDGILHAFHLEDGRASYRNRWVRTPKWLAEHDAGRALFGGYGQPGCAARSRSAGELPPARASVRNETRKSLPGCLPPSHRTAASPTPTSFHGNWVAET